MKREIRLERSDLAKHYNEGDLIVDDDFKVWKVVTRIMYPPFGLIVVPVVAYHPKIKQALDLNMGY